MAAAEHLYLHVPFCGHRCGYCDFVTVTGNGELHGRYVDALIRELRGAPARPATIFIGGGTPSLLDDALLARLLEALPACDELTVECNPETITPAKAQVLVEGGVTRVSLGAQSFQPQCWRRSNGGPPRTGLCRRLRRCGRQASQTSTST